MSPASPRRRIGVDTGGTFTDAVTPAPGGGFHVHKTPTTPRRPATAVLRCVAALGGADDGAAMEVVYGTTHATNALLTGRLGRAVFVTTAGFRDLLAVGRQERTGTFDLEPATRRPRQPRRWVVEHPDASRRPADVAATVERVVAAKPRAVAVCLLRTHRPGPEREAERRLGHALRRRLGSEIPVFLGHELAPEPGEYERGVTVWAAAALAPVVAPALDDLASRLAARHGASLRVLRSDGGTADARLAAEEPVELALSGPAAGLVAARALADARGDGAVLTFDMGGTSTDVALLPEGELPLEPVAVGGLPLLVRGVPVVTVGTGGGSLAARDPAGALVVGPDSAGADPGPACYGRGGVRATVTDAHLLAGRLPASGLLGGGFPLDEGAARAALAALDVEPVEVLEVATAGMERALRRVSLGAGWDPRRLTLYAFGGAGGLHAAWLAQRLGIARVVVPPLAGVFCAVGLLAAPPQRTLVAAVGGPLPDAAGLRERFRPLEERVRERLGREGISGRRLRLVRWAELRSPGRAWSRRLVLGPRLRERYLAAYEQRFGYRPEGEPVELARVWVQGLGPVASPFRGGRPARRRAAAPVGRRRVRMPEVGARPVTAAVHRREDLGPGAHAVGPALVEEYSATTVVPPGWRFTVDADRALVLTRTGGGGRR